MAECTVGNELEEIGTVVVGGGPAALALLLASRRAGTLSGLLSAGLRVVERTSHFGAGDIGRYAIRSDSHADSFVNALADSDLLLDTRSADRLGSMRGSPAPLQDIGHFLADVASTVRQELGAHIYDPVVQETEALRAERDPSGDWIIHCRSLVNGHPLRYRARSVVVATGATQSNESVSTANVGGVALFPRYRDRTLRSSEFLTSACHAALANDDRSYDRVTVIGGSHSAMASARMILASTSTCFRSTRVQLLHRSDLRITYQSPASARAEGYDDFTDQDICPKTGRVFPLAGFRCDSRDLIRAQWGLGGLSPNPRFELIDMRRAGSTVIGEILDHSDLIIAAIGYQSRGFEIWGVDGQQIMLSGGSPRAPMVDGASQVLSSAGTPIPGVFGLGMAAGYPLAGVHGEPSFAGQANGWALWRTEVGEALSRQLLGRLRGLPN